MGPAGGTKPTSFAGDFTRILFAARAGGDEASSSFSPSWSKFSLMKCKLIIAGRGN